MVRIKDKKEGYVICEKITGTTFAYRINQALYDCLKTGDYIREVNLKNEAIK